MARKKDERGATIMNSYKYDYEIDTNNTSDLNAITRMSIEALKSYNPHKPPKYENTAEGLELFKNRTMEYLQYVDEVNSSEDMPKKVVLDIEGWCTFLQITRKTLHIYYHERDEAWKSFIDYFKNIITAYKKQLAFSNKTPSIFAIFDLVNGSKDDGFYRNTNDIRIENATQSNNSMYVLPSERLEKFSLEPPEADTKPLLEVSLDQEDRLSLEKLPFLK